MIVLDTNVISEAMKPEPGAAVRAWLNDQAAEALYLSTVTLAKLLSGIGSPPAGKRKNMLSLALDGFQTVFGGRVLPFDVDAVRHHAELAVTAWNGGRGFMVASRDTAPYQAGGLQVLDPWAV